MIENLESEYLADKMNALFNTINSSNCTLKQDFNDRVTNLAG